MEGESSSSASMRSKLMVSVKQELPTGSETELLKIENAVLSLIGYNGFPSAGVIRTGEFSLKVTIQSISSILIALCMVGDVQWPITKDAPVLRVGWRSFAFAMPGLIYGLQFAENCCQEQLLILSWLFKEFAHFEDHSVRATGFEFSVPESEPRFWWVSQPKIQLITDPKIRRIGTMVPKASTFMEGMNEGLRKAFRMSAVVKLITQVVLMGYLDQNFFDIFDTRTRPDESKDPNSDRASPTIFVFSDIVEAVEATKFIVSSNFRYLPVFHPTWNPVQSVKLWNINKKGLMFFLHALLSSAPLNYNREAVVDEEEKTNSDVEMLNIDVLEEDVQVVGEAAMEEGAESCEATKEEVEDDEDDEATEDDEVMVLREIKFPIMERTGTTRPDWKKNS
ncbi:uncharacterized protein LOC122648642 [Telopea speciosissima]|uniref:uncharacterized protein LOC122648642 n=1 Tax=Telopea speciosissima TaxID=54955 RepID=UPI001CC5DE4C|nr:uncharacterized protein LOC122648642 [Telopea speciosissima]